MRHAWPLGGPSSRTLGLARAWTHDVWPVGHPFPRHKGEGKGGRTTLNDADLNDAASTVPGHWAKVQEELESVLLAKSEDKSEAVIVTKRSSDGILAWALINNWYMATSGFGICQRMAADMHPVQSKSDSEVMYDVERWQDEVRELMALGQLHLTRIEWTRTV